MAERLAFGTGAATKEQAQQIRRQWLQAIQLDKTKQKAAPSMAAAADRLSAMGIGVTIVKAKG